MRLKASVFGVLSVTSLKYRCSRVKGKGDNGPWRFGSMVSETEVSGKLMVADSASFNGNVIITQMT